MDCAPEVFNQFEENIGTFFHPNSEAQSFLHAFIGKELKPTDMIHLEIPEIDDSAFEDWTLFEYWCDEIKSGLFLKFEDHLNHLLPSTPSDFFKTKSKAKEAIIKFTVELESQSNMGVWYLEINSEDKKLFLIIEGIEGGALGHDHDVLVLPSLDCLNSERGFYERT